MGEIQVVPKLFIDIYIIKLSHRMLKYSLKENQLITRRNNYLARTYAKASYNKTEFIKRLIDKGTLVTETDAVAVLNAIENTVVEIIEEGGTLNLPLFNTSFTISGVFDSPDDSFDEKRHKLNINLTKGTLLRDAEKRVTIEKIHKVSLQPQIIEVKDILSGEKNGKITPGGVLMVRGHNIKITDDDMSCGMWFTNGNSEVQAVALSENKPSMLIAVIPALDKGRYQVKIVTQYTPSERLKTPKTCIYPAILSVL